MQILNLILSVLAIVLAGAALITVTGEKRRSQDLAVAVDQRFRGMAKANEKSRAAMVQYADQIGKTAAAETEKQTKTLNARIDKVGSLLNKINAKAQEAKEAAGKNAAHIDELEKGLVPDFEMARKAVDEVNNFNAGIAGILGFDPLQTVKKRRQEDE